MNVLFEGPQAGDDRVNPRSGEAIVIGRGFPPHLAQGHTESHGTPDAANTEAAGGRDAHQIVGVSQSLEQPVVVLRRWLSQLQRFECPAARARVFLAHGDVLEQDACGFGQRVVARAVRDRAIGCQPAAGQSVARPAPPKTRWPCCDQTGHGPGGEPLELPTRVR